MRDRWYAAGLAGVLDAGLGACAADTHDAPLLASDGPLWGLTQAGQSDFDSVTVAGETVLVARNPSSEWILEAREASNGRCAGRIASRPIRYTATPEAAPSPARWSSIRAVESWRSSRTSRCVTITATAPGTGNASASRRWTSARARSRGPRWIPMRQRSSRQHPTAGRTSGCSASPRGSLSSQAPRSRLTRRLTPRAGTVLAVDVATGTRLWTATGWDGVGVGGGRVIVNEIRAVDRFGRPQLSGDVAGLDVRRGGRTLARAGRTSAGPGNQRRSGARRPPG